MKEICMMGESYHYIVAIKVNNKKGVLLVDTGASRTVFDKTRFERFKVKEKKANSPMSPVGLGGQVQTDITILKNLKIDKLEAKNYLVAVTDLGHINHMFVSLKQEPIDGVLGSDFLKKYRAIIDLRKLEMLLEFNPKEVEKQTKEYIKNVRQHLNV